MKRRKAYETPEPEPELRAAIWIVRIGNVSEVVPAMERYSPDLLG